MRLEEFLLRIDHDLDTEWHQHTQFFTDNGVTMANLNETDFGGIDDWPFDQDDLDHLLDVHYAYMMGRKDGHIGA